MNKIIAIVDLFRKGSQVANPTAWKDNTNIGLLLGALIMAVLSALKVFFDIDLHMELETANSIGAGVGCLVAFIVNNISSRQTGLLPPKEPEHPIAMSPFPEPKSGDGVPAYTGEAHPKAVPEALEGPDEEVKGLSNGGMPHIDEAKLKEALRALRRDRNRPD